VKAEYDNHWYIDPNKLRKLTHSPFHGQVKRRNKDKEAGEPHVKFGDQRQDLPSI